MFDMKIQYYETPGIKSSLSGAKAVRVGNILFISGIGPFDRQGNVVGKGNLRAQAVQAFENMKTLVQAANASMNDTIHMVTYLTCKPEDYYIIPETRKIYIEKDYPSASGVFITGLPHPDMMLVMDVVVAVQD